MSYPNVALSTPHLRSDNRGSLLLRLARSGRNWLVLRVGGERAILLNSPEYAHHVLSTRRELYSKETAPNRFFRDHIADGILTAEGESWAAQRAVLTAAFRDKQRLIGCTKSALDDVTATLNVHADTGFPVNLTALMSELTLGITTRTLFGLDHEPFLHMCQHLGFLLDDAVSMLPKPDGKAHLLREEMLATLRQATDAAGDECGPALAALIADPMHDEDKLVNQLLTLLLAGYETTANSLTWAWILLAAHPDAYRQLQRDERACQAHDEPTEWATAVFSETLRLYPSAWIIGRRALSADRIGDVSIPEDSSVIISPFLLQRHPRYWADADTFDPARFVSGGRRPTERYAYIPFGAGPRFCIGSMYAVEEAALVLSTLTRRFTFRAHNPAEVIEPQHKFVLRAPDPFEMTVSHV